MTEGDPSAANPELREITPGVLYNAVKNTIILRGPGVTPVDADGAPIVIPEGELLVEVPEALLGLVHTAIEAANGAGATSEITEGAAVDTPPELNAPPTPEAT
jgi:hypothetical protein